LPIIQKLQDLNDSVDSYYARLFKQALRQPTDYKVVEPVRDAGVDVAYKTVEKHPTSLTIPEDLRPLNSMMLTSDDYTPIDVNEFMDGLRDMASYRFMDKVKNGLSTPFQLWSRKMGGSAGISSHFI